MSRETDSGAEYTGGAYQETLEVVERGGEVLIVRRFEGTNMRPEIFRVFEDEKADFAGQVDQVAD